MRDVAAEKNVIEVQDGMSGDVHELNYRRPTNKERAAYQAALFERKKKKVVDKSFETRLRFGKRICTGFVKGTFGANGKAFSCEPEDVDYLADWKEQIAKGAPEVLTAMAFQVFEGTGRGSGEVDFESVDIDDLDDEGEEKPKAPEEEEEDSPLELG